MSRAFYLNNNEIDARNYQTQFDQVINSIQPNAKIKDIQKTIQNFFGYIFESIMESNSQTKLNDYQKIENSLIGNFLMKKVGNAFRNRKLNNINPYDCALVDSESEQFKLNNSFVKKIAKLDTNAYTNMLHDLNNYTNQNYVNNVEDIKKSILKLRTLENARKSRNIFRRIGDFITGKTAREDAKITSIKNNIKEISREYNLIPNNVEYALKSKNLNDVDVIDMNVDVTVNPPKKKVDYSKASIFNDNSFVVKLDETRADKEKNAQSLADAVDNYNALLKTGKLPKNLKISYKEELIDACKHLGFNEKDTNKLLQYKESNDALKFINSKLFPTDDFVLVDDINELDLGNDDPNDIDFTKYRNENTLNNELDNNKNENLDDSEIDLDISIN